MTRSRLLWPIGGLIVLFVLYGAYWFYASTQIRDGVNDWIAAQERAGYQIEHDGVRVGGFPYRFRIRLISPHVRAPESDGGWYAHLAALHADALPYDLSHWIVTFGGPFLLDDYIEPGSQLELNVSDARVSLVYGRDGDTERVGAEVRDFQVTTHAGRAPDIRAVEELILSGRVIEEDQLQVRLAVRGVTAAPGVLEPEVQRAFAHLRDGLCPTYDAKAYARRALLEPSDAPPSDPSSSSDAPPWDPSSSLDAPPWDPSSSRTLPHGTPRRLRDS